MGDAAMRQVYVSCNPATQARDVAALCGADDDEEEGQGARYKLTTAIRKVSEERAAPVCNLPSTEQCRYGHTPSGASAD
jgi:hypothetical protein